MTNFRHCMSQIDGVTKLTRQKNQFTPIVLFKILHFTKTRPKKCISLLFIIIFFTHETRKKIRQKNHFSLIVLLKILDFTKTRPKKTYFFLCLL